MTKDENSQYQTSFESNLSFRYFIFNFFVYFIPLFWTAFDQSNDVRYSALATLVFTQMVFKQTVANIMEVALPYFLIKPELDK